MEKTDKAMIQIIEDGALENTELIGEDEKETALNILENLKGHLIIRADVILNFCKKAIKYKNY